MSRFCAMLLILAAAMLINTVDAKAEASMFSSPSCSGTAVGSVTGDSDNQCYPLDGFSAFRSGSIQCFSNSSGVTHTTTLYTDSGCTTMYASGSGPGNNTCTQLVTSTGAFAASVKVNCNSAATAAGANIWTTGAIIAASVVGLFMLS